MTAFWAYSHLCGCSEKEKRATAVALKLEEERKAGETARLAKAEQHRAVQQHQKQIAQEVRMLLHHFKPINSAVQPALNEQSSMLLWRL